MLKRHMAACLVATATLISVPAFAQTSPPVTNPPTTAQSSTMPPSSAGSVQFMNQMTQDQWRASKLVGLNIYGANNEKIGDINEVILDRSGNAKAVVIGVGGFLGIGEKNVAVPFQTVEWTYSDRTVVGTANPPTTGTANPPAAGTGNVATTSNSTLATSTAPRTDVTGTTVAGTRNMDYPDHGILRMTKADLQNAPAFHYASDTRATTAPATTAPATTAPAPVTAPKP